MRGLREGFIRVLTLIRRAPLIDKRTLDEIIREIQRTLLKADVSVELILDLSNRIRKRVLEEKGPPGFSKREILIKILYEELVRILGGKERYELPLRRGKTYVLMLVGIQGSGKTTTAAKIAYHYMRKGFKVALVSADTYRPGAYDQLEQLSRQIGVPMYGERDGQNAIEIAKRGVERFRRDGYDLIIIDTAGRHKEEEKLLREMEKMVEAIRPNGVMLVLDATIGKQAGPQAEAFHKVTRIGYITLTKLDGSAKGGGALAAVARTGARIVFIGIGEKVDELEPFDPQQFVARILGMGDLKTLLEKFQRFEKIEKARLEAMASGKFTLLDLKEQFRQLTSMGPLSKILELIPDGGVLPKDVAEKGEESIKKWLIIMDSMTMEELINPRIINYSRMKRIARGSGTTVKDVRELLRAYERSRKIMKKLMKQRKRWRGIPFKL